MSTLTKQQVILSHVVTNDTKALFCERLDEPGPERRFSFPARDWTDMGSPDVITVTIQPGDHLNDAAVSA